MKLDHRLTIIHCDKSNVVTFTGMNDEWVCMELKNGIILLSLDDKDMFYYWNGLSILAYLYRFNGHSWGCNIIGDSSCVSIYKSITKP